MSCGFLSLFSLPLYFIPLFKKKKLLFDARFLKQKPSFFLRSRFSSFTPKRIKSEIACITKTFLPHPKAEDERDRNG